MFNRILMLVILINSFLLAQGRIILPNPEKLSGLPAIPIELVNVEAKINMQQDIARVSLKQSFFNKSDRVLQGDYIYSLPGITQIDDFYLWIDGQKTKGQLLDKDKAQNIYENIVRSMRDPALLEFIDYGLFKARIFPIPAGATREIALNYSQVTKFEAGNYRFELPIRQSGQGAIENYKIEIELEVDQSLDNIYSPTHKIQIERESARKATISFKGDKVDGNQNFILFYSLSNKDISGSLITFRPRTDRDGYFMFFANPAFGKKNNKSLAKDVIFVIDVSGSMGGEKIEQAREALRFCVNVLDERDRFEIISFSSALNNFTGHLQKADREAKNNALYFIDNLSANGGTNINVALQKAFTLKKIKDARPTSIVFLTDGLPTEGEQDVARIVGNVQSNAAKFIRFFNFGVGYDVNTWLLDNISSEMGGSVTYVKPGENIESAISSLFTKISSPLLTDTEISFKGVDVYDVFPQKLPDVFKGQRIMITGRYRKHGNSTVELTGKEEGRKRSFEYNLEFVKSEKDNDFVAKLWANRKVNYLLNRIRFEGENQEWVTSIKNLGQEFGIVTPYTSYLVTEQQKEYANIQSRPDLAPMAAQIQKREEALKNKGMTSIAYEALGGAMATDANAAIGKKSVMGSSMRQSMMQEAEQADDMLLTHKNVMGKSFVLENGVWKEQGIDIKSNQIIKMKFMDDTYLKLSKQNNDIKKILALGSQLIFEWKGKIYQVEK